MNASAWSRVSAMYSAVNVSAHPSSSAIFQATLWRTRSPSNRIRVTGTVSDFKGSPQVLVDEEKQLELVEGPPPG